jgi:hypothetical protein
MYDTCFRGTQRTCNVNWRIPVPIPVVCLRCTIVSVLSGPFHNSLSARTRCVTQGEHFTISFIIWRVFRKYRYLLVSEIC